MCVYVYLYYLSNIYVYEHTVYTYTYILYVHRDLRNSKSYSNNLIQTTHAVAETQSHKKESKIEFAKTALQQNNFYGKFMHFYYY